MPMLLLMKTIHLVQENLLAYYNLEQYPETHLFYGPLFTDQYTGLDENEPYVDDKPKYEKD